MSGSPQLARIIPAERALEEASRLLLAGSVIAIPTETVYGLAADATNGQAVARIFEAKRRPSFNPLIAHVCDLAMAERIARLDSMSRTLAAQFWPGPLTLVLEANPHSPVHELATAGLDTVAVRMPVGIARQIVARIGRPIAAPSANRSGRLTATTAAAVEADLGDRIPLIVDGGPTPVGVESTILSVQNGQLRILRPGAVTAEEIEAATGVAVAAGPSGSGVIAPGMLTSHYAPSARMRLNVRTVEPGEALLAFGPHRAEAADRAVATRNLSATGNLAEAAANLYAHLHALDATGATSIAVEPVPATGLGIAINDRLSRAAAPRDNDEPDG